jgi:hypothetical protein
MAESSLIPVFVPPLALILAQGEKLKGSALTESEVEQIRDKCGCIMMEAKDAEAMTTTRGFRDVNPENCWADWHRLRAEMIGNGFLPKIVFGMVGGDDFAGNCRPILEEAGVVHEFRPRDERMVDAFKASMFRLEQSLDEQVYEQIAGHITVLYFESSNFSAQQAPAAGRNLLQLGRCLLEAGGIAMKCESSGIAHGRQRWIELAGQSESAAPWAALFRAYVQFPLSAGDDFHTCGMHLLGKPDLIMSEDLMQSAFENDESPIMAVVYLFEVFALYLLGECPDGSFASGHTFRTDAHYPRLRVRWERCTGYDEDDLFFNPFGRWRFAERVT